MKKIYVLLGLCVIGCVSLHAQRKSGAQIKTLKPLSKKPQLITNGITGVGCDTLFSFPADDSITLYGSFDYGFVSGTNADLDKEKMNYFDLSGDSYNYITGAAVYFGYGNSSVDADLDKSVLIKVYADNNGYPGVQIGSSTSIPLSSIKSDVDNNYISSIPFSSAILLPDSKKFYVSVDISNFSYTGGDSIAIYSTYDSSVVPGTAWERWSDNSTHNLANDSSYTLNFALAILPFVSTTEDACGTLPVKLISFDAARKNKDATINWKVAEESNMKGYQLEKADNNNNYKPVTFIKAHNDYKNNFYTYTDANAFATASAIQYRLKQIDGDGKTEYSKIVSLKADAAINNVVFANPFNGSLRLQLNLANASQISINIYDMKGNLVGSEKPITYNGAANSIEVKSAAGLHSGMYILKITAGAEQLNYKIIKQ